MYGLNGRIINLSFSLNKGSFDHERGQFNALILFDQVQEMKQDSNFYMGVTAADIYVPKMNFIYGIADIETSCAILSVARLISAQYEVSSGVLKERVLKEAAHELGHLLGLGHCSNDECLMSFSNNIIEVDMKKPIICDGCRSKLS